MEPLSTVKKTRTTTIEDCSWSTSSLGLLAVKKIEEEAENERTPTGFHRAGSIILATSYSRTT
jgi:hypothetical protein